MKEEILNSVGEAGIYSVQINSTQDITSTDKYSIILRFVRENVEQRLLTVVDFLCNLLKEVLQKQNKAKFPNASPTVQVEHQTCLDSITDFQLFLKKSLLFTFTHSAMLMFSIWFSVMLLRLIMHPYLYLD